MKEVTGNLQIKNGKYYVLVNLYDHNGKRSIKWVSLGLDSKGNKKAAISGCYLNIKNIAVLIAGCMHFICKLLFVISLVENSTLRVSCGFCYAFCFRRIVFIIRKRLQERAYDVLLFHQVPSGKRPLSSAR